MSRMLSTLKEWVNPDWARHRSVPPFEAGLRPNRRLDEGAVLLPEDEYEPDDLILRGSGEVVFSSGNSVFRLVDGAVAPLVTLGGQVGSLVEAGDSVIAAVDGVGLVAIDAMGRARDLCTDPAVASCVTDLAVLPDGALLCAIGSCAVTDWAAALVADDRSGRIVRIDGARAQVVAEGLAWPAGIESDGDTGVVVSLSFDHRLERRSVASLGAPGQPMGANLPVYPGRIRETADGWWVAAPYARNRFTELLLDEPEVLREMTATIPAEQWFVPRLRCENPYTDTLQLGQLRVHGVIKPWAPARSYGLAFRVDSRGRITESVHSRADGDRHGVTGVASRDGRILVAARGFRNVIAPRTVNGR
ncbi:hypothetical protein [Nocardia cyriacigeorgica]|uniref:hypothetical protein n=1 Tax=Nocardia cyriacigeorgica TaxID=135487 RepID=UPI0013D72994|nr:hypothetical protein [Nocardia cyriacigeorgica]NEW26633.1 hypothetical protein [Nocardia cyriacigeorgica]